MSHCTVLTSSTRGILDDGAQYQCFDVRDRLVPNTLPLPLFETLPAAGTDALCAHAWAALTATTDFRIAARTLGAEKQAYFRQTNVG